MKFRHSLLLLPILLLLAFNGDYNKQYYPTGELLSESTYDRTCNCDHYTEYYKSGKVKSTASYKHTGLLSTQIDGPVIHYFENGTICLYSTMVNGAEDGRLYSNFINGKLAYEHFFKNGYKDSTWTEYNEDGSLQLVQQYEPGKTEWNSNFDCVSNTYYFNGKPAYTEVLIYGKKDDSKIIDKALYAKMQAVLPPPGQQLFMANCAMCHRTDRDVVGPKLAGVTKRRSHDWLKKMITNGDALKQSGDPAATSLYSDWMQVQHPDFTRLEDAEVEAIVAYLAQFK